MNNYCKPVELRYDDKSRPAMSQTVFTVAVMHVTRIPFTHTRILECAATCITPCTALFLAQ